MNSIVIFGRITKDVEVKATSSGLSYTRFNIASKSSIKDDKGEYKTNFFTCLAWRDKADRLAKFVKKGDQLIVKGSLNFREYEKNGEKVPIAEVNVEDFSFVSSDNLDKAPKELKQIDEDDEDLPF